MGISCFDGGDLGFMTSGYIANIGDYAIYTKGTTKITTDGYVL
jgi:hypothetical protein